MHVDTPRLPDFAAKELSRHERHFGYEDHQLWREEAYPEIARRLRRRARQMLWVGGLGGIFFAALSAFMFVTYGRGGMVWPLFIGVLTLVAALLITFTFVREATQIEASTQKVLELSVREDE